MTLTLNTHISLLVQVDETLISQATLVSQNPLYPIKKPTLQNLTLP